MSLQDQELIRAAKCEDFYNAGRALRAKANINVKDAATLTAYAAASGDMKMLEVLLRYERNLILDIEDVR